MTTLFFVCEFPSLAPGEPPAVRFQSILNPFNFLGVRRNPQGDLELVSDVSHHVNTVKHIIQISIS